MLDLKKNKRIDKEYGETLISFPDPLVLIL